MKEFFIFAVLLFSSSNAKPHPAKRSLTCSDFPVQLSGRLVTTVALDSGSSITTDMRFNVDHNLQRLQGDVTAQGKSYTIHVDWKNHKSYLVYPGGCLSDDDDLDILDIPDIPDIPDESQLLKPVASGKLGLNGASVDLYSIEVDGSSAVVTLEGGDKCILVSFASKQNDSSSTESFLDLKTTVDSEKMKIPVECMNNKKDARSSAQAILYAVKRGFPWIQAKKRGFPWIEAEKRGFPWIESDGVLKRGFPWVEG